MDASERVATLLRKAGCTQRYRRWSTGRHPQCVFCVLKRLDEDLFPRIGSRPVSEVPTAELQPDHALRRGARSSAAR
jgi:hypothetical protein